MTQLSDHQLLDRFRADHDRSALDTLVRRYIDMVYSAALRQVRDAHLAEDITQAVFIVLVRSARTIRRDAVLAAWLFTVTRHAAANAMRVRNRQRYHEMHKMLETPETVVDRAISDELRANLDDAIASLPTIERNSIVLHFLSNQSHKEVGQSLGMSEEAARKRVARGLDRMRAMLAGRGVNAMSASVMASAFSTQSAPAALVGSTVNIAFLSSSVAPASAATLIAKGVTQMIAITKLKIAATIAAAVLLAGGVASPIVAHMVRSAVAHHRDAQISTLVEIAPPSTQPADKSRFAVDVTQDTHVEFLGVSKYPPEADSFTALDGTPIDCPDDRVTQSHMNAQPAPDFMVAAKVTKPDGTVIRMRSPGSSMSGVMQMAEHEETVLVCAFSHPGASKTAKIEMGISEGQWNTVAANANPKDETTVDSADLGGVTMHAIEESGTGVQVSVEHAVTEIPTQIVIVDDKGTEHKAENINVRSDGSSQVVTCIFELSPDQVEKVLFQSRPFTKFVDVTDISLEKGTITHPEIKVRDAKDGK